MDSFLEWVKPDQPGTDSMLRIRKLTDYAVVVMVHLARVGDRSPQSTVDISAATRVPAPTVAKVLKALIRQHLVQSKRGVQGGYLLARHAQCIDLAQIIDGLEGPMAVTECSNSAHECGDATHCELTDQWPVINQTIRHALAKVSLLEIAARPTPLSAMGT